MPSNSGSKRPPRPPSPPPPPPRRVSRRRKKVSESEEVSQETESEEVNLFRKKYQRRHGKDIYEVPDEVPPESSKEAKRRRNLVQDHQELSKAEKDELQSAAVELFLSNNPTRFLSLVCDFASSSVFHQNPQSQVKALWNFFAHQYPNALSLMLARLLNSRLPSNTVMYTVDLLHLTINRIHGQDRFIIDKRVLFHLKPLLLNVIQNHESIPNLLNLSEIAARIFEIERWGELLDYLLHALDTNFETRQEMALRVLSTLPESREECLGAYKFWWANHKSLNVRFGELFDSPNLNIQALTFDSSIKLVRLLHRWRFYSEIDVLLPKMISFLRAIHGDGQTRIVEPRIMDLVELASYYTDPFLTQLDVVLDCMFRIAVTADDNTFLTLQAIKIIKMVDDQAVDRVSEFLVKLSEEAKRSIFKNCVRLLVCIADVPAWYDVDMTSSEYMGISEKYILGKFLLFRLCWDSHEDMLLSFGIELIPQYLNSEDWQTRHAGLVAFAETGSACSPAMIRDHAERVLEISLTDPHPRVLWAAIEVIRCLTTDSDQEHVRYLNNFVPRLVTIIRSASIYPRIQLHAATVVRRLINNCGDEEVKSFAECLEPELLKFVKQGGVFREEAIETLKLLAASFPVIFRRHYQETMDSLRDLVSQSLFGAQSMEYLSYILSGILSDESLFVLNDSQEVINNNS
ncbi:importin subunit beta-3-like [Prosopis cineraria]|uniref:importin subunit beta-3-like n=1 Tax=Prosopis cineraria TaxID=364024 RepID=UPI00240FBCFB|nr:importin subunit beta-3-like [Prosopis cineraria]